MDNAHVFGVTDESDRSLAERRLHLDSQRRALFSLSYAASTSAVETDLYVTPH